MKDDNLSSLELSSNKETFQVQFESFATNYIDYQNKNRNSTTPKGAIKQREGAKGKKFDFIQESYVLEEMDKRIPGWSSEFIGDGIYLLHDAVICVGHIIYTEVVDGVSIKRKRMVVGAEQIKVSTESGKPVKIDDVAKAALTDWHKLAGLRAAYVGADIYKRSSILPTKDQQKKFNELISLFESYIDKTENEPTKSGIKNTSTEYRDKWKEQNAESAETFLEKLAKICDLVKNQLT